MLPIYGINAGAYQKCEFVIPAEMLSSISGKGIQTLKFHVAYASQDFYISECTVFMKEVGFTSFENKVFTGMDDATIIYAGPLNATGGVMEIPIENIYSYDGGNLLIGLYIMVTDGLSCSVDFRGVDSNVHTGIVAYDWGSYDNVGHRIDYVDFYPMMTLDCIGMDHDLIGDNTHGTMTFKAGEDVVTVAGWGTDISLTVEANEGWTVSNISSTDVELAGSGPYTFTMPDKDVHVTCTWLRDISVKVDVTEPLRFPTDEDVKFELTDVLDPDNKVVIPETAYTVTFDKEPTEAGKYTATFTGNEENGYTGTFTKEFTVQEKITIELAAHYMGTYFFDSAVETFAEDQNTGMELGTVTAVSAAGKATIAQINDSKIKAQYPFLIYNNSNEPKTFTLWKAIDAVTTPTSPMPCQEFTGTDAAKPFNAEETATKDYYVLQNYQTGDVTVEHEFVYVIGAGEKPAHRCWIELAKSAGARILTITIDEPTGISDVKAAVNSEGWYDLQGRRLTSKPSQRGMYVIDGQKVVVK